MSSSLLQIILLHPLFYCLLAAASRGDDSRTLLQRDPTDTVRVTSENELLEAVRLLAADQRVLLEVEEITLNETLVIDAPGILIRGVLERPTRIRCHKIGDGGALVIRDGPTRIESVEFSRCRVHSAVVVHQGASGQRRGASLSVTFRNVHFSQNGDARAFIYGGAVRVGACDHASCAQAQLRFVSCRFSENRATYGGAMYAEDVDLEIIDSTFSENEADLSGGAVYMLGDKGASLTVEGSLFERNAAHGDVRVHRTEESVLLETNNMTLFTVGMGAAIFARDTAKTHVTSATFRDNHGCRGSGGIGVIYGRQVSDANASLTLVVTDSRFEGNYAFCVAEPDVLTRLDHLRGTGGGLMSASFVPAPLAWEVINSTFIRNRAARGGAVYITSSNNPIGTHHMRGCTFRGNAALSFGGSIGLVGAHVVIASTSIKNSRAVYGGGIMAWADSRLDIIHDPANPEILSDIEGCLSYYGGGLQVALSGPVSISAIVIRNNTALRSGGGIEMNDVVEPVTLKGVQIKDNRALMAGAIATISPLNFTVTSDDYGNPTVIEGNIAATGAGLYIEPGHNVFFIARVQNATFRFNEALSIDSAEMQDLIDRDATYAPLPAANVAMPDITEQLGNVTLLDFLASAPSGHGGAICVAAQSLDFFIVAEIMFQNLNIMHNTAAVGGGMSIHLSDLYWNRGSQHSCLPASFGLDSCQRLVFVNVTVTQNKAEFAAGVFSTLPDGISVSCSANGESRLKTMDALFRENTEGDFLSDYCSSVVENELLVGEDDNGKDVGTKAVSLMIAGWNGPLRTVASGDLISIPCINNDDPSCFRALHIAVKDAFNQTIVRGIEDSALQLVLFSDIISGALRYVAEDGIAVINSTVVQGINRTSTLIIADEGDPDVRIELKLSTRECHPGESIQGSICSQCPRDQYGFWPELSCEVCEANANCTGGAALLPVAGHWHSSPFSPVFRECILPTACTFSEREEKLHLFYQNASRLQEDLRHLDTFLENGGTRPESLEYEQCSDGYEGFLCGSCAHGYGHSLTKACEKCPEEDSTNGILVVLTMGWVFLVIGVNCVTTLLSANARIQLVRHEVRLQSLHHKRSLSRSVAFSRNVTERFNAEASTSTDNQSTVRSADAATPRHLAEQVVASVQLTETLKILMNYVQVTSAALHLQTDWHSLLESLLAIEAFMAGLFNEMVSVPFECNFDRQNTPPSIAALWMRLAVPWMVLCALLLTFLLSWFVMKSRQQSSASQSPSGTIYTKERLATCLIVIVIVTVYFSFIDFVKELLRAVNCVSVRDSDQIVSADHSYIAYALESDGHRTWAEDTDFVCFEGDHLPVGIVGVLGLALSLSGVLFIILWLPFKQRSMTEPEFVARYWFLYQAYRKKWYTIAWESTILTRKALIAAVVVSGFHLGPSLQAALCVGILITSHALHSLFVPFKVPANHIYVPDYAGSSRWAPRLTPLLQTCLQFQNKVHLNHLESVSLTGSILVFWSGVVLHDSNVSASGRRAVASFAFVVNVSFLVFLLYRLYAGCHVLIDLKLEMADPNFIGTHRQSMSPLSLFWKTVAWIQKQSALCRQVSQQQSGHSRRA